MFIRLTWTVTQNVDVVSFLFIKTVLNGKTLTSNLVKVITLSKSPVIVAYDNGQNYKSLFYSINTYYGN